MNSKILIEIDRISLTRMTHYKCYFAARSVWALKNREDFAVIPFINPSRARDIQANTSNLFITGDIYLQRVIVDRHLAIWSYFRVFKTQKFCPCFQSSFSWLVAVITPLVSGAPSPGTTNKASPASWTTKTGTKVSRSWIKQLVVWRWLLRLDRGKTRHAMPYWCFHCLRNN